MASCAISHKRGSNAQFTVDYYIENRGDLPNQLIKLVKPKNLKEAQVSLGWTIDENGQTRNIKILRDNLHNESVNNLLIEHLKAMKFPKSPHFTTSMVEYTYKFHSQKK